MVDTSRGGTLRINVNAFFLDAIIFLTASFFFFFLFGRSELLSILLHCEIEFDFLLEVSTSMFAGPYAILFEIAV